MRSFSWRFPLTILLLAATLAASSWSERRHPYYLRAPLDRIASRLAGWTAVQNQSLDPLDLKTLRPTSYLARVYQKQNRNLSLFIAFYAQQRAGESMHSPKHCLPGSGWEIWQYGSTLVPVGLCRIKVNHYSIQKFGERSLVLYWYQSHDRIIASEYLGKILLIRDALWDGRTAGSIVRLILKDEPGALEEGVKFASGLIPQVQNCFGD